MKYKFRACPKLALGGLGLTESLGFASAVKPHKSIIFLFCLSFRWRIISQPGKKGIGKNTKSLFFLLGLKFTLRTCFESKNFSSNSCPELSNPQLSFSACQIYQQFRVRVRHSFFIFLTSDGQVWIYLRILRPFPEQSFSISVK